MEQSINNQTTPPAPAHDVNGSQTAPTETHSPKPKRHIPWLKIFVFGLVCVITLAAFGLIAYLLMGNSLENQTKEITSYEECVEAGYPIMESYPEQCTVPDGPSFTRELTDEEKAKLDPTADWKAFSNNERAYSFKYPNSYTLNENEATSNTAEAVTLAKDVEVIEGGGFGGGDALSKGATIRFTIWPNKDISDQALNDQFGNSTISKSNINGVEFITVTLDENRKVYFYDYSPEILEIFLNLGSNNTPDKNETYINEYKQILSTFKFTDASAASDVDTSDWKTYANSNYGISFKYPTNWTTTKLYSPESYSYTHLNLGFAPAQKVKTGYEYVFAVEHYDNPNNLTFQEWDKKLNEGKQVTRYLNNSDTKIENIAGLPAFVNEKANCEPVLCKEVIIMHNNNIFVFRNIDFTNMDYTKEEIESYKPIFDQMLSTVKLTN